MGKNIKQTLKLEKSGKMKTIESWRNGTQGKTAQWWVPWRTVGLVWLGFGFLYIPTWAPENLANWKCQQVQETTKKLHTITVTKNTQDALAFPRQRTGECLDPAEQNPFDNGKSTLAELCKQENDRVDGGSQDGCSWGSQYSRNKQWLWSVCWISMCLMSKTALEN